MCFELRYASVSFGDTLGPGKAKGQETGFGTLSEQMTVCGEDWSCRTTLCAPFTRDTLCDLLWCLCCGDVFPFSVGVKCGRTVPR